MAIFWDPESTGAFLAALEEDLQAAGFRASVCKLPPPYGESRHHLGISLAPRAGMPGSVLTLQQRLSARGYRLRLVPASPATFCVELEGGTRVHFC